MIKFKSTLFEKVESKLIPKKIKLDIIYEDKDILIVNKQAKRNGGSSWCRKL